MPGTLGDHHVATDTGLLQGSDRAGQATPT
jgi:hypothetical protein